MRTFSTYAAVIVSLSLISAGCGRKQKVEEGKELSRNPISALSQIGDAAKKAEQAAKEAAEMKPVDPIHFSKLVEILPTPPTGWKAEEPRGETTSGAGFRISEANRSFRDGEKSVDVKIVDGAFNAPIYAGVTMLSQFARESTEGYEKGITLDGQPGFEKWTKSSKGWERTLLVAKRYLVTVTTHGLEPDEAVRLFDRIDRKRLADLK